MLTPSVLTSWRLACFNRLPCLATTFRVPTAVVALAILTNASSVAGLGTSNRLARVVDRTRVAYAKTWRAALRIQWNTASGWNNWRRGAYAEECCWAGCACSTPRLVFRRFGARVGGWLHCHILRTEGLILKSPQDWPL